MIHKTLIAASLLFLLAVPLLSAEKLRIAIMDFDAQKVSRSDAVMYTELIRNEMINVGEYRVVERKQMGAILKEQGLQMTGCTDISCAVEAGKILSAEKIMVGTIMKIGKKIVITGRILDVEKGLAEFSEKAVIHSKDEIVEDIELFVRKLNWRILGKDVIKKKKADSNVVYTEKKYTIYPYSTQAERLKWASISFSIITGLSFVPPLAFQVKYSIAKNEFAAAKSSYEFMIMARANSALILTEMMGLKKLTGDMKNYLRYRDYCFYSTAGLAGLTIILGAATLIKQYTKTARSTIPGLYKNSVAFYPLYYCLPDARAGLDHNFGLVLNMRF